MKIVFGTEGWRAIIAEQFTFENVCKVTQAISEHFLEKAAGNSKPLVMAVGFDTRFMSERFATAVSEVLAGNGIKNFLADGAVPTCAVSRYVVDNHLSGGVVITASHNPAAYNGIKVKESFGGSANPDTVSSIENRIGKNEIKRIHLSEAIKQETVQKVDMLPLFIKGIKNYVNFPTIKKSNLKILIDPMYGTGDSILESLLKGGKCKVETLHAQADPTFGGHAPEPIAIHLKELSSEIRRKKYDIGLATDGDADRIGVIAPDGKFLNPGQVMCILLDHIINTRRWTGGVVKTVSNTSMITRMANGLNLKLFEVPVGFKYVAKHMLEDDVVIGGEESGGIGIRGYLPERDGILMSALVLEAMAMQKEGILEILGRLEKKYGRWIYVRRDLTVSFDQVDRLFNKLVSSAPSDIAGVKVDRIQTLDGVKLIGKDESWLLFRRSGTEPIVRVYAESLNHSRSNKLLDYGVDLVRKA